MDKIVIIEEDPGIRTVLRLALKGAGFTFVAPHGAMMHRGNDKRAPNSQPTASSTRLAW